MTPLFRFTLNNSIAGSLQISEPIGWDSAVLKLERNMEFHSLVEFYDQPLTFYGQNSEGNGGLDYIREIEESQGPDAQITILIELSVDGGDIYITAFDGLIDITSCKEIDFYKAEYGIIRNDFWQKFMNRKGTPVDLAATTDLDGNAISVPSSTTLSLVSQKISSRFVGLTGVDTNSGSTDIGTTSYLMFTNDPTSLDEIGVRFDYGTQLSSEDPRTVSKYIFKVQYDGNYRLDISIECIVLLGAIRVYDLKWFYAIRSNGLTSTQIGATITGTSTSINTVGTPAVASASLNLLAGDEIYIFGLMVLNLPTTGVFYENQSATTFSITADTSLDATSADSFLILDAVQAITSKITGSYPAVSSDYLNHSSSPAACGAHYAILKGLHVRGYSFSDKPFFLSFDDWWRGANPILNLGLGYIEGTNEIEIEQKGDFYDSVPVLNLDYVNFIERSYQQDFIFKSIEIGYEKWSAESGSGIDDPQTKRVFRTRFKTVGSDVKLLSKFYAASLGIEQTRRNRVELGKDWRLDEDTMIVTVAIDYTTAPELSEPFSSITGLLNHTTRYNTRITPVRNLLRWRNFLNGCLKWYSSDDDLSFASGEGNSDVVTTLKSSDCEYEPGAIGENADIDAGAGHDFLFVPIQYEFEHPLTWDEYKAIRDYRKKAIGVSRTNTGHVSCFIMNLEYHVTRGLGKFTVLLGQETPL